MNSGTRGLIVSIVLFFLWGTMITGPFRYLSYAFRNGTLKVLGILHTPPLVAAFIVITLLVGITVLFLIVSATKISPYLAGIGAILSTLYCLYRCIESRSVETYSFVLVVGLAVTVLFLLLRVEKANEWMADAYFYAIPVLLFYELVVTPLYLSTGASGDMLLPFIMPDLDGLLTSIGNLAGVPMLVWGIFLFMLMLLPVIVFSRDRSREEERVF